MAVVADMFFTLNYYIHADMQNAAITIMTYFTIL